MSCRRFEDNLDDLLEGRLAGEDRRWMEEHARRCSACGELQAAVRRSLEALPGGPDLTAGVLRRTTGPACERARGRIGDLMDELLSPSDSELVGGHLDHCRDCGPLAEALGWVLPTLATMAEVDPGPEFTEQVARRTSRRPRPARSVHAWLAGLLQRPRLAFEGAYVGAFLLVMLFGTPFSPLHDVPSQALALAQVNPVHAVEASVVPQVTAFGEKAWDITGGRMLERTAPARASWKKRLGSAWAVTGSVRTSAAQVWKSVLQGDLEEAGRKLKRIGADLVEMWVRLTRPEPEPKVEDNDNAATEV